MIIGLTAIITLVLVLACLILWPHSNLFAIASLIVLSSVVSLSAIYFAIVNRIEKLNHKISVLSAKDTLSSRININGNDEVKSIADNINLLLDNVEDANQKMEQQAKEITQALQESNNHLKQEISAKTRSEKMIIDREYLMQLGKSDEITSLPNGIQFNEILNKAITYSQRRHQNLAILLVNLDLFKLVQDTFGQIIAILYSEKSARDYNMCCEKKIFWQNSTVTSLLFY